MNHYSNESDLAISHFQRVLEKHFTSIIEAMKNTYPSLTNDQHLVGTASRLAKSYARDYFWGLGVDPSDILKGNHGIFNTESDAMVTLADIPFVSWCSHHFVNFSGRACVAYIPDKRMVGLSKIPRMIDVLSHRPQVQERLTEQIADCLVENLQPKGVGVLLEAEHSCISIRGVEKSGVRTRTTALRGVLTTESAARAEFLAGVK